MRKLLFVDSEDPAVLYVRIGDIPFEVIGVMAAKSPDAQGSDRDDALFVVISTELTGYSARNIWATARCWVKDVSQIDAIQQAITDLLIARHQTEDFRIRNMASIIESATETQNTFTMMLGIVAAISYWSAALV